MNTATTTATVADDELLETLDQFGACIHALRDRFDLTASEAVAVALDDWLGETPPNITAPNPSGHGRRTIDAPSDM